MHRLSVAIVAMNESANLGRVLESVRWADEIVVVDSGSTDETVAIAEAAGARVFHEAWRGYGAQVNAALDHCTHAWLLNLDADEVVSEALGAEIQTLLAGEPEFACYTVPRLNNFMGRWMRHGGLYPDRKLRLFHRGHARLREDTEPHATPKTSDPTGRLTSDLLHYAYPTLGYYIGHMNSYSSSSVPLVRGNGWTGGSIAALLTHTLVNPALTFIYNYGLRLGFLDGREGLLFHLYHSAYVSWKYAKAWEAARPANTPKRKDKSS